MDVKLVQRVCEELKFIYLVRFRLANGREVLINIQYPRRYRVWGSTRNPFWFDFSDLSAAIRFIENDCTDPIECKSKGKEVKLFLIE